MTIPRATKLELISWLEDWFTAQCDGDWEHSYGIEIETLDNPGWTIKIDLQDTYLIERNYLTLNIERSQYDWLKCRIENGKFEASCGPQNLSEVLIAFRHWAESP